MYQRLKIEEYRKKRQNKRADKTFQRDKNDFIVRIVENCVFLDYIFEILMSNSKSSLFRLFEHCRIGN